MANQESDQTAIASSPMDIPEPEAKVARSKKQVLSNLLMGIITVQAGLNQIAGALAELIALEESDPA